MQLYGDITHLYSIVIYFYYTLLIVVCTTQDCSFPAYFYTQPMATGPGFYDNLCPQSWQDGSAATWTLQDPHQQSEYCMASLRSTLATDYFVLTAFDCPGN